MKKLLTLLIAFLCIPFLSVQATPPIEHGVKITIESNACNNGYFNGGHIDLLVLKEEANERLLTSQSDFYQNLFGHIDTIDYIASYGAIWISYLAYVQDAYVEGMGRCQLTFMFDEDMFQFSEFKLVLFSDEGETLFVSTPIEMIEDRGGDMGPEVQDINVTLDADDPYHIDVTYEDEKHSYFWIFAIILGVYVFRYGLLFFGSLAAIFIMYAIIYVMVVQIKRRE
jgi:hypothetical protein